MTSNYIAKDHFNSMYMLNYIECMSGTIIRQVYI